MIRRIAGIALGLLACHAAAAAPPPAKPRLIVAISVDQFSDELYRRYRSGFSGGLKRLSDGVTFTGYQSHGGTETCPGHSTLLTGMHPSGTGIVANDWIDRATWRTVYCVSVPGAPDPDARGPQNLRASTLGEWMKAADPRSWVVAISGKDRAAITMAGHRPDAVYWWKDGEGFVTSRYAGPAGADVTAPAEAFNRALFASWTRSAPALWPREVPAECQALERGITVGTLNRTGRIPPDLATAALALPDYAGTKAFQEQLRGSPLFDTFVLDFAEQVIRQRKLGQGRATDLLALSFSATDHIGHRFGNGGAESCVQVAALDRTLGRLFARLDRLKVPYVVVLSADHGAHDAAERARDAHPESYRIDTAAFRRSLLDAVRAETGIADPLALDGLDMLYVKAAPTDPAFARIAEATTRWLKAQPQVEAVLTAREIEEANWKGKPVAGLTLSERFRESFVADRSGDIFVIFRPHASLGMPSGPAASVAGHGSPWDYDRQVPILFWWRGAMPDQRTEAAETVDIAPTLAAIARIPTPAVDGTCLQAVAGACQTPADR